MATERDASILRENCEALLECRWEDSNEPGAYVERGSGDLYPRSARSADQGGSPLIMKQSRGRFAPRANFEEPVDLEARRRCAHNVEPNF